jgi:hypothetical protein
VPVWEYKTRGPQSLRPRDHAHARLIPETQVLDDLAVAVDIRALHVIEKPATLPVHLQKATATVMILLVETEVVRQIFDALGKERDLNACRSAIRLVRSVLRDRARVVESHALGFLASFGGVRNAVFVGSFGF